LPRHGRSSSSGDAHLLAFTWTRSRSALFFGVDFHENTHTPDVCLLFDGTSGKRSWGELLSRFQTRLTSSGQSSPYTRHSFLPGASLCTWPFFPPPRVIFFIYTGSSGVGLLHFADTSPRSPLWKTICPFSQSFRRVVLRSSLTPCGRLMSS